MFNGTTSVRRTERGINTIEEMSFSITSDDPYLIISNGIRVLDPFSRVHSLHGVLVAVLVAIVRS